MLTLFVLLFRAGGGNFGGNGGLSIRNVEKVKEVLRFQKRMENTESEDRWLTKRLGLLPKANMCSPEAEKEFAVDDLWHEWPMGYHVNSASFSADVWQPKAKRKQIFDYCPEIKIILDMRLERERCQEPPEPVPQVDYDIIAPPLPVGASPDSMVRDSIAALTQDRDNAQFSDEEGGNDGLAEEVKELEDDPEQLQKGPADGGGSPGPPSENNEIEPM
jgi:hypothetical protein